VPSAKDSAASCIHTTPRGFPASAKSSAPSSSSTPAAAQVAATAIRGVNRAPKKTTASRTVQIGIVKPRIAARPEASA
jgi:hypothetical protein